MCTSIFAKYGSLYSKYIHNMRQSTADAGHSWAAWVGEIQRYIRQPRYLAGLIYARGPRITGFHCICLSVTYYFTKNDQLSNACMMSLIQIF